MLGYSRDRRGRFAQHNYVSFLRGLQVPIDIFQLSDDVGGISLGLSGDAGSRHKLSDELGGLTTGRDDR